MEQDGENSRGDRKGRGAGQASGNGPDVQGLINRRRYLKGRITALQTIMGNVANINNIATAQSNLDRLHELFKNVENTQMELEELDQEGDGKYTQEGAAIEAKFMALDTELRTRIEELKLDQTNETFTSTRRESRGEFSSAPSLPKIKIPTFSGVFSEWINYKDLFGNMVHKNNEITNVQKMYYLKASLSGEAAALISSIDCSSDNYRIAWNVILKQYDDKMLLANQHINAILDIPKATRANQRKTLNLFNQHYESIKSLKLPNLSDTLLINILSKRLDAETLREFEIKRKSDTFPTLQEFLDHVHTRCRAYETLAREDTPSTPKQVLATGSTTQTSAKTAKKVTLSCVICSKPHPLSRCFKFSKLKPTERRVIVEREKLCFLCLKSNHSVLNCHSQMKCNSCGRNHHTMLHLNHPQQSPIQITRPTATPTSPPAAEAEGHMDVRGLQPNVSSFTGKTNIAPRPDDHIDLTSTALVLTEDVHGTTHTVRVLLDSACERNLITVDLVNKLGLNSYKKSVNWRVSGVGNIGENISETVKLSLRSRINNQCKFDVECGILSPIARVPSVTFEKNKLKWPSFVNLADPNFNVSSEVDILLSAHYFFKLVKRGKIDLGANKPVLVNTSLGWVFGGMVGGKSPRNTISCCCVTGAEHDSQNVAQIMSKFFEVEEVSPSSSVSEDDEIEKQYVESVRRDSGGRYCVDLPLIPDKLKNLGKSVGTAIHCLRSMERRFAKDPAFFKAYKQFIDEFVELGHAIEIDAFPNAYNPGAVEEYYLPHHAVMKTSSSTTMLRCVFNASAPSSTGVSLNDVMRVGPVVQPDLVTILLRFRMYRVVLISDITKMYRQIEISTRHQPLQRILWRDSPTEKIRCLQLTRVTYGTASASYLATRTLIQLVRDEGQPYPLASEALLNHCYMDDIMPGSDDLGTAMQLQRELATLLSKGGFELHKWYSNNKELLNVIPLEKQESCNFELGDGTPSIKTLGVVWCPEKDSFQIQVPEIMEPDAISKRRLLADIAKIFDPLGLVGPIVTAAKIIMQEAWKSKVQWDEDVPIEILNKWKSFWDGLRALNSISIPRLCILGGARQYELCGFADASMKAYGACVYLKSTKNHGEGMVRLLCSKSRVAPLKTVTLPRLELCAALLLAKLMKNVNNALTVLDNPKLTCFTDSTIALCWIRAEPSRWSTFVANRVAEIQQMTTKQCWRHVKSSDNPADLVSRGVRSQELQESQLWWSGPTWLGLEESAWPPEPQSSEVASVNLEEKINVSACATTNVAVSQHNDLGNNFENFSSWTRLNRCIAFVLRFIANCRVQKNERLIGYLTTEELRNAMFHIIKVEQTRYYSKIMNSLLNKEENAQAELKVCKLQFLNPFVDSIGLLRVGGRIKYADLPELQRFPMVLPSQSHVAKILAIYEHERSLHAGAQSTLAGLRSRFWIVNGRNLIRNVIHKCIKCFRFRATGEQQLMADLPAVRVTPTRAFLNVGVDFAGPIQVRQSVNRRAAFTKGYIALFVCMVTKCLHLELVPDLSSQEFLNALTRFWYRRGKPERIFSDNATTFKGANHALNDLYRLLASSASSNFIFNNVAKEGIKWCYIPTYSPHWGNLWESGVKMVKNHLKRIVGSTTLTYEQLNTVLISIEGIVNSRPLCALGEDPNDVDCLTPAHFVIQDKFTAFPEPNHLNINVNRLSVYQKIIWLKQTFWKRWSAEYITSLQHRYKWNSKRPDLKINDVVLIREDNLPPLTWALGKISDLMMGRDGHVRAATVKTKNGMVTRPITKLCLLPID